MQNNLSLDIVKSLINVSNVKEGFIRSTQKAPIEQVTCHPYLWPAHKESTITKEPEGKVIQFLPKDAFQTYSRWEGWRFRGRIQTLSYPLICHLPFSSWTSFLDFLSLLRLPPVQFGASWRRPIMELQTQLEPRVTGSP